MKTIYVILIGAALLLIAALCGYEWYKADSNSATLKESNSTLFQQLQGVSNVMRLYKSKDSLSEISSDMVQVKYQDMINFANYETKRANDAQVQMKYLQSISITGTHTIVKIDSSRIKYVYLDSLRCFSYNDRFTSFSGCLKNDSLRDVSFETTDSLFSAIQRIPHQFWFIKWGTKAIRQVITTNNSSTQLFYNEYILIK